MPDVSNLIPELSLLPTLPLLHHLHVPLSHQSLLNLDVEGVLQFLLLSDEDVKGGGSDEVVRGIELRLLGRRGWDTASQMDRLTLLGGLGRDLRRLV